jgi:hypothetical protein
MHLRQHSLEKSELFQYILKAQKTISEYQRLQAAGPTGTMSRGGGELDCEQPPRHTLCQPPVPPQYPDIPLSNYPNIPLSHYSIIPLSNIPLSHYPISTLPISQYPTLPLSHYPIIQARLDLGLAGHVYNRPSFHNLTSPVLPPVSPSPPTWLWVLQIYPFYHTSLSMSNAPLTSLEQRSLTRNQRSQRPH